MTTSAFRANEGNTPQFSGELHHGFPPVSKTPVQGMTEREPVPALPCSDLSQISGASIADLVSNWDEREAMKRTIDRVLSVTVPGSETRALAISLAKMIGYEVKRA